MRRDEQQTTCPFAAVQVAVITIRPETRVNKTDQSPSFAGDDQPVAIEPRLGEDVLFNELWRNRLNPPPDRALRSPDLG